MKLVNFILFSLVFAATFVDLLLPSTKNRIILYAIVLLVVAFLSMIYQSSYKKIKIGGSVFAFLMFYSVFLSALNMLSEQRNSLEVIQLLFLPILYLVFSNCTRKQIGIVFWSIISANITFTLYVLIAKISHLYIVDSIYLPGGVLAFSVFAGKFIFRKNGSLNTKSLFVYLIVFLSVLIPFGDRGDLLVCLFVLAYLIGYKYRIIRKSIFWIPILVPLVIGILVYVNQPNSIPSQFTTSSTWTIGQRMNLWGTSVNIASEKFPFGVGYKHFNEIYRDYLLQQRELKPYEFDLDKVKSPHNQIMLTLAEGGGVAVIALLGIFKIIMKRIENKSAKLGQTLLVSIWATVSADWFYGSTLIIVVVSLAFIVKSQNEIYSHHKTSEVGDRNENYTYY